MRSWDHVIGIVIGLFGVELVIMLLFSMLLSCSSVNDYSYELSDSTTTIIPADYSLTNTNSVLSAFTITNYSNLLFLPAMAPLGTNVYVNGDVYLVSNSWLVIEEYYYNPVTNYSVSNFLNSITNYLLSMWIFWYRITN